MPDLPSRMDIHVEGPLSSWAPASVRAVTEDAPKGRAALIAKRALNR